MSSIRKNLFIWLLLGLTLLWAIAGAGIYLSVKQGEVAKIDSELQRMEGALRFIGGSTFRNPGPQRPDRLIVRPPRENFQPNENRTTPENRITQRWPDFLSAGGPKYIIWLNKDTVIRQSEGLSTKEFKFPEITDSNNPIFFNISLQNGDSMRAMASTFRRFGFGRPRPRGNEGMRRPNDESPAQNQEQNPPRNISLTGIIALNSKPMEQTLNTLLFGIIAIGIVAGFFSFSLVHFALKNGLKPLYALGNKLASVDSSSLSHRFSKIDLPVELSPICEHLNKLMERLEDGFERERRFSGDLAHELRTPIAELKMMAEVALRWPENNAESHANETLDIAQQLQEIIESLLALNRYDNGDEDPVYEKIPLHKFTKDCWDPFVQKAEEKNIKVAIKISNDHLIETDPKILRLIINNLFSNAAEYTPSEGIIAINGNQESEGHILSISNSVENFDEEMLSHLFERLWRGDISRTDGSHSGLGLALSKACSKCLGLNLEAELIKSDQIKFVLSRTDIKS
jgi:signal transduction histidine kinase|tara:strand:- start:414 stop:1955 length:1542 start_codon:yes stop_codon:yes gene_type:complete